MVAAAEWQLVPILQVLWATRPSLRTKPEIRVLVYSATYRLKIVSGVAVRLGLAVHPSLTCTCSAVQLSLLQLMPAVLLCGAQSSSAGSRRNCCASVFLIFPPARPPGKSFCCLGPRDYRHVRPMKKERQPLRALRKNV